MPTENRSSNTEMVSAAPAPKRNRIYVEVRECEGCNHIGIDDAHSTLGACHECDWSGPDPVEDKCPGCGRENVIAAACPDCGSRYVLAASKEFEIPAPQPHPEPIAWMVGTAIWWAKEEAERDAAETGLPIVGLGPMAAIGPAEQRRGEPVAPAFIMPSCENCYGFGYVDGTCIQSLRGYRDHLEEIVDSIPEGPLYTHPAPPDPGEVERLESRVKTQRESMRSHVQEVDRLRVLEIKYGLKIEERNELLRKCLEWITSARDGVLYPISRDFEGVVGRNAEGLGQATPALIDEIGDALSDSAAPSAPTPLPDYMEAVCDKFDWTPEEALRFYADGKHFDTDRGRTRILCTGAIASHTLKGMGGEYADMKGIEPSAPVEHDHDALVAAVCVLRSQGLGNLSEAVEQARSALECKPS